MTQHIPLSLVLTPDHIAWLDAQRQHGNLSRSAALRVALDRLIEQDVDATQQQRRRRPALAAR